MVCNLQRMLGPQFVTHGNSPYFPGGTRTDRKIAVRYRVLADGKDITDQVFYVDAHRRIVRIFKRDASGRFYLDSNHELARAEIRPRRVRLVKRKRNAR